MANILIADDDVGVVELMATILSKAGHQVSTSGTGLETLRHLGLQPDDAAVQLPDLIVLDIMMPKSDGYTVGTVIRNNPRTRTIPILVVTALREMSRLFSATVKVDGFLTKPFSPEDLVGNVAKILSHRKPQAKPSARP
jgi:CheY-like chemotaxis protein